MPGLGWQFVGEEICAHVMPNYSALPITCNAPVPVILSEQLTDCTFVNELCSMFWGAV